MQVNIPYMEGIGNNVYVKVIPTVGYQVSNIIHITIIRH